MNTPLTPRDPVSSSLTSKSILVKDGYACSLLMLAPGDEMLLPEARHVEKRILFVIEGDAIVRCGELNTMLKKDEALLLPRDQAPLIAAGPTGWAKLLRVDMPPRQVIAPPVLTIDR